MSTTSFRIVKQSSRKLLEGERRCVRQSPLSVLKAFQTRYITIMCKVIYGRVYMPLQLQSLYCVHPQCGGCGQEQVGGDRVYMPLKLYYVHCMPAVWWVWPRAGRRLLCQQEESSMSQLLRGTGKRSKFIVDGG